MEAGDSMSNRDLARRTRIEIAFDGVDLTDTFTPYLLSVSYTDNEEDEADDLQIKLHDRDGIWMHEWLTTIVNASSTATEGLTMHAVIVRENWNGDGSDAVLDCGAFALDSIDRNIAPATITLKGTSMPYTSTLRQTLKTKSWEAYSLSGIANEMAQGAGMSCMYLSTDDPYYARVEQLQTSDIGFLSHLCHNAGISLKITNKIVVLFDQVAFEQTPAVFTIAHGSLGGYSSCKLSMGAADTAYASCKVQYTNQLGNTYTGVAVDDTASSSNTQQLVVSTQQVSSDAQAQALAEKMLRRYNKFACTAQITLPGNPLLVAGVTVELSGFGAWDGKYLVSQAKHTVDSGGYATALTLRHVMEGY